MGSLTPKQKMGSVSSVGKLDMGRVSRPRWVTTGREVENGSSGPNGAQGLKILHPGVKPAFSPLTTQFTPGNYALNCLNSEISDGEIA